MPEIDKIKTRRRIEEALRKTMTSYQLAKIAEELGVEVAYRPENVLPHHHDHNLRPCFGPNQVRCLCELQVGKRYNKIHAGRGSALMPEAFTVTKEPYQLSNTWWVNIKTSLLGTETSLSLADHSVCEYFSDASWSTQNYIAFRNDEDYGSLPCHHHSHYCNPRDRMNV